MTFDSYSTSTNFVGKDGFHWWVGQVEKGDDNDKLSNRYKVRIVGHHLQSCEAQKTDDLPWANTVAPTTDPFSNAGSTTTKLYPGDWVIGFYMDSAMAQQPYILGSIGTIANSESSSNLPYKTFISPNPEGCRAFTNFAPDRVAPSPYIGASYNKSDLENMKQGYVPTAKKPPGSGKQDGGLGDPASIHYGPGCIGGPLNPAGQTCTIISQAQCPTGKTASKLQIILSELFKIISQSGGGVGSLLTSKITGYASDANSFVFGYINKAIAVIMQGYGWLKGELYGLLKQGVQFLINSLLSLVSDKAKGKDAKPPYDPKKPRKLLDKIQKFLTDQLAKIGCSIEDLYDRILKFLTDLIFGALDKIWSQAFCAIDALVNNIMNKLQQFLSDAVSKIMGPLQSILGSIAAPLDAIGKSIGAVMNFLGIKCSGLPAECKELITDCGEGPKPKKGRKDDALDRLLADIAKNTKPSPNVGICEEARVAVIPPLDIVITGGIPKPTTVTPSPGGGGGPSGDDVTTTDIIPTLSILLDPQTVVKNLGEDHTFTVIASTSDGSRINYQWQKYDANIPSGVSTLWENIPGANTSSYTVRSIKEEDDTDAFRCIVRSSKTEPTSLESDIAELLINPASITPTDSPNNYFYDIIWNINFITSVNDSAFDFSSGVSTYNYSNKSIDSLKPTLIIRGDADAVYKPSPSAVIPEDITYKLTATPSLVSPGGTVTLTLETSNIPNGTNLEYYIFGANLTLDDVVGESLVGNFKVSNNKAKSIITISSEVSFSERELVFAALRNGAAATQFVIEGTRREVTPQPEPVTPRPPIACDPIVSTTGKIIDIPICDFGTPFLSPPAIYIQSDGFGYGASAVAVLNDEGFISKIKVVRPGRGYPPNPPRNLDCIITGFTIIKSGFGYDTEPIVYIDDEPNLAEAVIQNGVVVNILMKDKSRTFDDNPTVKIVATTTGLGAIAIANISCIDKRDAQSIAEVVGPTPVGEYIDCP